MYSSTCLKCSVNSLEVHNPLTDKGYLMEYLCFHAKVQRLTRAQKTDVAQIHLRNLCVFWGG